MKRLIRKIANISYEQAKIEMNKLLSERISMFNQEQQEEIIQGFIDGLTKEQISLYCDNRLSAEEMKTMRLENKSQSSNQQDGKKTLAEFIYKNKSQWNKTKDEIYDIVERELTNDEIDYLLDCYIVNQYIATRIFELIFYKKIDDLVEFKKITDHLFSHFNIENNLKYLDTVIGAVAYNTVSEKKLKLLMDESIFNNMPFVQAYSILGIVEQINDSYFEPEQFTQIINEFLKNRSYTVSNQEIMNDWYEITVLILKSIKKNINILPYLSELPSTKQINDDFIKAVWHAAEKKIDLQYFNQYKHLSWKKIKLLNNIVNKSKNETNKEYLDICLNNIDNISYGQIKAIYDAIKRNIPFDVFKKYMHYHPDEVIHMNELQQWIIEEKNPYALETFHEMMGGEDKASQEKAKQYRKDRVDALKAFEKMRK